MILWTKGYIYIDVQCVQVFVFVYVCVCVSLVFEQTPTDEDIYSIFVGDLSCDTLADKIVTSEQHIITTVPWEWTQYIFLQSSLALFYFVFYSAASFLWFVKTLESLLLLHIIASGRTLFVFFYYVSISIGDMRLFFLYEDEILFPGVVKPSRNAKAIFEVPII